MSNFLDQAGLSYFWSKIKNIIDIEEEEISNKVDQIDTLIQVDTTAETETIDGDLYAELEELDWTDLIEQ